MFLARLKTAAALLAALTCTSAWMIASIAGPTQEPPAQEPRAAKGPGPPKTRPTDRGPEVAIETVRRSRWTRTTSPSATVGSYGTVDVYPRISGYLHVIPVEIGEVVKAGQVLAQIDDPGLAVAVQKARAEVERARAHVKKAGAAVRVAQAAAKVEHARVQAAEIVAHRINDRSQLLVAQAAEEEAQAKIQMAEAERSETASEQQAAEAGLREAQIREGYARIVAPFDGVVTRINYHDGALVRPPDQGRVEPILTVVRSDIMLITVFVQQADVPYLDRGDPATIRIDALGERGVFQGSITYMAYVLDSRGLRAEIALANKDGRLRPGLDGRAEIQLSTRENVLTIPQAAIVDRGDRSADCFRVVDGRAVPARIKIGDRNGGRVEVLEGLNEGDTIIIPHGRRIAVGQPVKIRPEPQADGPPGR